MRILDSDHCIAILRRQLDLRRHALPGEELAVTTTSIGELVHAAEKSARPAENLSRLDVLVSNLTVLPFDDVAARHFGRVKAGLERAELRLGNLALQIAAIALDHECPLLTHSQSHFRGIEELRLEDWL